MTLSKKLIFGMIFLWAFPLTLSACNTQCNLKNVFIETPLSSNPFFDMVDMKRNNVYFYHSIINKFKGLKKPGLWITGEIENSTSEHLNTSIILEKLRSNLINKQRIRFIDTSIRPPSLAKKLATKASLILKGRISGMQRQEKNIRTIYYMTYLEIVELKTGKVLWADTFTIGKKVIKKKFR